LIKIMTIKMKKSKITITISFILFIILMAFWPYFDAYFPKIDNRQVIGLIAAVIFGMFIYFDERLDSFGKVDNDCLKFGDLSEILLASLKERDKNIRTLDVFAFTTGVIQPIISNSGVNVDTVRVIVMEPKKANILMKGFADEIILKVKSWQSLKDKKIFSNLDIRYYGEMPSDYFLVIDNNTIVAGTYSLDKDNKSTPVEIFSPFRLNQSDELTKKIINSYMNRFESLWKYCE
jgi:hypothetical protein